MIFRNYKNETVYFDHTATRRVDVEISFADFIAENPDYVSPLDVENGDVQHVIRGGKSFIFNADNERRFEGDAVAPDLTEVANGEDLKTRVAKRREKREKAAAEKAAKEEEERQKEEEKTQIPAPDIGEQAVDKLLKDWRNDYSKPSITRAVRAQMAKATDTTTAREIYNAAKAELAK